MMSTVEILDTTLRDGEQMPGLCFRRDDKLAVARALEDASIDTIEAGFPASSAVEAVNVQRVAHELRRARCSALARIVTSDVEAAARALEGAPRPRIHLFAAGSERLIASIHRCGVDELASRIAEATRLARRIVGDVQVSLMDVWRASESTVETLARAACQEGAEVLTIADTVGIATPDEVDTMVRWVRSWLPPAVRLGVHMHNDLGLATANTIAGLRAGAGHAEVTIAGVGERAGNAALEEVVTVLRLKGARWGLTTNVLTERLTDLGALLCRATSHVPQPNKAILGENAFLHASGIHQAGVVQDPMTFEPFPAELVGRSGASIMLGKLSGRVGIQQFLDRLVPGLMASEHPELVREVRKLLSVRGSVSDEALVGLALQFHDPVARTKKDPQR